MRISRESIRACLRQEPLAAVLADVRQWPPHQAVSPLIGCLFAEDERTRWYAVSVLGAVIADLAEANGEAARNIMRRLMWSLNDESGSIGWGAPEALAEAMVGHAGLAEEFGHLLVAYMRPDGCYLELPALQRGLMWGIGRMAATRPHVLRKRDASLHLPPYLDSPDAEVRGLAARALGLLRVNAARQRIECLRDDPGGLRLYEGGELAATTVGALAGAALTLLR